MKRPTSTLKEPVHNHLLSIFLSLICKQLMLCILQIFIPIFSQSISKLLNSTICIILVNFVTMSLASLVARETCLGKFKGQNWIKDQILPIFSIIFVLRRKIPGEYKRSTWNGLLRKKDQPRYHFSFQFLKIC